MENSKLVMFKDEWMCHRDWWFGCEEEADAHVTNTYADLLQYAHASHDASDYDKETVFSLMLVYDQLPYHVYRHRRMDEDNEDVLQQRKLYQTKAIEMTELLLRKWGFGAFSGEEFGFLMLPYRHTYEWDNVYKAIRYTWQKIRLDKHNTHDLEQLRPFLKATFARCPMLSLEKGLANGMYGLFHGGAVIDWNGSKYRHILDYYPSFQDKECNLEIWKRTVECTTVYKAIDASLRTIKLGKKVIVSLSGGVDSMVVLWVLVHLQKKYDISIGAVHVNYCNRDDIEEEFVVSWCTALGVDIYVRRIREIQRAEAMDFELRATYETYTRDCRYHAYREAWNHMKAEATCEAEDESNVWVVLGHNQDDCFENILTNICQKQKFEELSGMAEVGTASGIRFWRPMLTVPKKDIYQFAKEMRIPYLHDSTPSWSCRGKIRDKIRPVLEEFHHEMIPGFFHMCETMKELMGHIDGFVNIACKNTSIAENGHMQLCFGSNYHLPKTLLSSEMFWRLFLTKKWNVIVGMKAIGHLSDRVQDFEKKQKDKSRIVVVKGKEVILERKMNEAGGEETIMVTLVRES